MTRHNSHPFEVRPADDVPILIEDRSLFSTTDLVLAGYLIAEKVEADSVAYYSEEHTSNQQCRWFFARDSRLDRLVADYYALDAVVRPQDQHLATNVARSAMTDARSA